METFYFLKAVEWLLVKTTIFLNIKKKVFLGGVNPFKEQNKEDPGNRRIEGRNEHFDIFQGFVNQNRKNRFSSVWLLYVCSLRFIILFKVKEILFVYKEFKNLLL